MVVSRSGTILHCKVRTINLSLLKFAQLPNHPNCWGPTYTVPSLPPALKFNPEKKTIEGKLEFSPSLRDYISVPVQVKCRVGPSYKFEMDFDLNTFLSQEEARKSQEEARKSQEEARKSQEDIRRMLEAQFALLYEKLELNATTEELGEIAKLKEEIKMLQKEMLQKVVQDRSAKETEAGEIAKLGEEIKMLQEFKVVQDRSAKETEVKGKLAQFIYKFRPTRIRTSLCLNHRFYSLPG